VVSEPKMTSQVIYKVIVPIGLVVFQIGVAIIAFVVKNSFFKKIDEFKSQISHMEGKLDSIVDKNDLSHEKIWIDLKQQGKSHTRTETRIDEIEKKLGKIDMYGERLASAETNIQTIKDKK
jgi:phage-related tail protein